MAYRPPRKKDLPAKYTGGWWVMITRRVQWLTLLLLPMEEQSQSVVVENNCVKVGEVPEFVCENRSI